MCDMFQVRKVLQVANGIIKVPIWRRKIPSVSMVYWTAQLPRKWEIIMLEVAMQTTIMTLYRKGYSKTSIAEQLHIDRKTVRRIIQRCEAGEEVKEKKPYPSQFDEYRETIEIQLAKGLTVKRIYQDLQAEFQLSGSYSGLRDYCRKLYPDDKKAYMVMHSLPGEEAQVDFGCIGTLKVGGKPRKAWAFVMSLLYSRYDADHPTQLPSDKIILDLLHHRHVRRVSRPYPAPDRYPFPRRHPGRPQPAAEQ